MNPGSQRASQVPRSFEAEQVVLGITLVEPDTIARLMGRLTPDDFYDARHRTIFEPLSDSYRNVGVSLDIVTLSDRLVADEQMDQAGGRLYLNELMDRALTSASADYYVDILREKTQRRALLAAGNSLIDTALAPRALAGDSRKQAEDSLHKASLALVTSPPRSVHFLS